MSCNVCCDPFNKSTRKVVNCTSCDFTACRKCYETYFIENSKRCCMNCKVEFSKEHLYASFTKVFIDKQLRQNQKEVLFSVARSTLHLFQEQAESSRNFRKLTRVDSQIRNKKKELTEVLSALERTQSRADAISKINGIYNQIDAIEIERAAILKDMQSTKPKKQEKEKVTFLKKCEYDGCNGYTSNNECMLCGGKLCKKCGVKIAKEENPDSPVHVCKPEDIATQELLKNETKPCPRCGTPVVKVEGCRQVWVRCCKIAFDYYTGKIETHIHAADYTTYLRENDQQRGGRNGDLEDNCNLHANNFNLSSPTKIKYGTQGCEIIVPENMNSRDVYEVLLEMIGVYFHIQQTEFQRLTTQLVNDEHQIAYLLNEIDDEKYKSLLIKNETAFLLNTRISNHYVIFNEKLKSLLLSKKEWPFIVFINLIRDLEKSCNETLALFKSKRMLDPVRRLKDFISLAERCVNPTAPAPNIPKNTFNDSIRTVIRRLARAAPE